MFSRKFIIIQVVFFFSIACIVLAQWGSRHQKPLPKIGKVQDFILLDTNNKEITRRDLDGKVWIADFIFTTCGSICPVMTKQMKFVYNHFRMFSDMKIVSISVNPENDTPDTLAKYASKNDIDTRYWYFLTGTREQITDLAVKSFKLGDMKEPIFHSPYFVLVDKSGNIRAYYDGTVKENLQLIAKDIKKLLMEKD